MCIKNSFFSKLKQTLSKKQQENVQANLTNEAIIELADPQLKFFYAVRI